MKSHFYEDCPMHRLTIILLLGLTSACSSTGATFRSGVGDTYLDHPPYVAGASTAMTASGGRVGILPVYYQAGASHPEIFDPRTTTGAISALLVEMNAFLDSVVTAGGAAPVRLAETEPAGALTGTAAGTPPDVRFGCVTELGAPGGDCASRDDTPSRRGQPRMLLAVGRPSPSWVQAVAARMERADVASVVVLSLEIGQYYPRQRGLLGGKHLELGTAYDVSFPWLTSLETPVVVLQVTGALMNREGRAVRIAAEGIMARRTRLLISAIGGQEILSEADVAEARTLQRTDLPSQPLAWREAMRQVLTQLTR